MQNTSSTAKNGQEYRKELQNRKRIVIKVGSSSLQHPQTHGLDYHKIDRLCREISDLKNQGKEVILVSSGATATGRAVLDHQSHTSEDALSASIPMNYKQACAAVGQARLMMIYQKFFDDYGMTVGQVLMTKNTITNEESARNLKNTFSELLHLGIIPIVNENDSVATTEFSVGDNDNLSALVSSIVEADLLILLSDVKGLYTDDPRSNENAQFIDFVPHLDEEIAAMGKSSTGSGVGTGGMSTKLHAARIATRSGADMVIANANLEHDMGVIHEIIVGENVGTLFASDYSEKFLLKDYVAEL